MEGRKITKQEKDLIDEIRCLKTENQALADSNNALVKEIELLRKEKLMMFKVVTLFTKTLEDTAVIVDRIKNFVQEDIMDR